MEQIRVFLGKHSEETWFCEQRAAVSVGVKGDGTGTKLGKTADLIAKGSDGDQSWRVLLWKAGSPM